VIGGGSGTGPSTTTTGTGILTFLGTPSSANLASAVTDETGTGSLVFGTSPTFTTSALFPAGTVSAPGIAASGDTNTGIYFPAADNVAIATGGVAALTADSSQNVSVTNTLVMGSSFKRNRLINGDMRVDQRNSGASVTPTDGQYTLDRFVAGLTQASKFSIIQSSVAPDFFVNSLLVTSLSSYSVLAGDIFAFNQKIEGLNIYDLGWGTANAKTVTLSFWVRSSLTGTFGGSIRNSAQNRSYPFTYSISAANTWEQKTLTITGDTTGTWLTTNGIGIILQFGLGVGSTYSGTANAWSAGNYASATGATSVVGTNGATFYITGVQLEVGSVATPYERQIYSDQLAQCQRYYVRMATASIRGYNNGGALITIPCPLPVTMRTSPTGSIISAPGYNNASGLSLGINGPLTFSENVTVNSTGTGFMDNAGVIDFSAEL
jgi:hypothetical protein